MTIKTDVYVECDSPRCKARARYTEAYGIQDRDDEPWLTIQGYLLPENGEDVHFCTECTRLLLERAKIDIQ